MSSSTLPLSFARSQHGALSFYSGLFCVTAATLMLQIIQTRILSVQAWYHLAFFVISSAMFGLTLGAVWVYLRGSRFPERTLSYDLAYYSAAFAISTTLSLLIQMSLPLMSAITIGVLVVWFEMAICLAVPFFFSGVVVSLALTRSPFPIGRVYGVDLIGAAAGCLGVLALLNFTDGPSAILWVAALCALASELFLMSDIGTRPDKIAGPRLISGRRGILCLILVGWAAFNGLDPLVAGLRPIFVKHKMELLGGTPGYVEWNSFSRVAVFKNSKMSPSMWGPSPMFQPEDWPTRQLTLNIDGDAATAVYGLRGDLGLAGFLRYDISTLAYRLPGLERTAVIGVGGGRDLLSARLFGVPEVVGVEINPVFIRLLTEHPIISEFVGLNRIGGIRLVVDEARNWFARSEKTFDLIQMSLIDTWAATGAGAFTLSENGLYTVEAWQTFIRRLTPNGAFTVSRWYAPGDVNETGRMVSLAVAALIAEGSAQPHEHIFLATADRIATIIVSKAPLTREAIDSLESTTKALGFSVLISPDRPSSSEVLSGIVESRNLAELLDATQGYLLDLTPATDDRPFFFNQLPFGNAAKMISLAREGRPMGIGAGNLYATFTLLLLFFVSAALVLATIIVPLRVSAKAVDRNLVMSGSFYFLLIGAGFMLIEIALLQRFSVFLGHPVYSLSIVLLSIILATGLGSLLSEAVPLDRHARFVTWSIAVGLYVFALCFWLPDLLVYFESAQLLTRCLLCVALVAPLGLLLGFGFPTGMQLISAKDERPTPWFWGINGASGVLASILAVGCSIAFGITATLTVGGLCYLLLIPAAFAIGFPRQAAAA